MKDNIKDMNEYHLAETVFNCRELAKTETIMCLGNGYLGLRSCAEETYALESRGLFVAGTFNKADESEVTELPNAADLIGTEIILDGSCIDFSEGKVTQYEKRLDLKKGLLTRSANWKADGKRYALSFERFVSQKDLHLIGQKIEIRPDRDVTVRIVTGINGRMTNSGAQHFTDGEKRFLEKRFLQMVTQTTQSHIRFFYTMGIKLTADGKELCPEPELVMDRRRIRIGFSFRLKAFQTLIVEKIMDVRTDRDLGNEEKSVEEIRQQALHTVQNNVNKGFSVLLEESAEAFAEKLWDNTPVRIVSNDLFDSRALHFAQYHLHIMTPSHDARMNIGAKGLSGEGYRGHTFWDTEIFALPYFMFSNPETAKNLVKYRYLTLPGARKKASWNGYAGAQFPWESAWLDDGEVTPEWGPMDAVTGLPSRIESGLIEQHITADVAFGVWQYFQAADDERFMLDYGCELLLETGRFWASRLELWEEDGKYHISDVMGPDEFKEHVDDNAFTNYMAWWNLKTAAGCCEWLRMKHGEVFERLNERLHLEDTCADFLDKAAGMYLPKPGEDNVLPQDRTYLTLDQIDLEPYKKGGYGQIYRDYSPEQISRIQISKQADVLLLFLLLEEYFPQEVKDACWDYYEPRTIHESSLSFSTHAILACDRSDTESAYTFFQRACRIDLGPNMHSCDDGVHAAAMAGIWQSTLFGFAGVRMVNGILRIRPALPEAWKSMEFAIYWKGQRLEIHMNRKKITVKNVTNRVPIEIDMPDGMISFDGCGRTEVMERQLRA